jgi:hypothetical protein
MLISTHLDDSGPGNGRKEDQHGHRQGEHRVSCECAFFLILFNSLRFFLSHPGTLVRAPAFLACPVASFPVWELAV